MVKKSELEKIETLDKMCNSSKHLIEVYRNKVQKTKKGTPDRLFFETIRNAYQQIASGSCGLFDIATAIATTEYLPREMITPETYKEMLEKKPSTT